MAIGWISSTLTCSSTASFLRHAHNSNEDILEHRIENSTGPYVVQEGEESCIENSII